MAGNPETPLKVWALSLGCPKNRADTERLLGALNRPVRMMKQMGRAQIVLINTCAFIEPATRESIRAILDCATKIRKLKDPPSLIVAGCLPGRYGSGELAKELPEVDLWLNMDERENWPHILRKWLGLAAKDEEVKPTLKELAARRIISTGPAYAWLKIGDGCAHRCTFCAIPKIRGSLEAESPQRILKEASIMLARGVRELNLVAQDVTAWSWKGSTVANGGKRQRDAAPQDLPGLCQQIRNLDQTAWLRLFYLYPSGITDALLDGMANAQVLPYFDIPLQHVNGAILAKMGRPFASGDAWKLLERIRNVFPAAAIRTTFITGFPGEGEAEFAELMDFVRQARFDSMGVFAYQSEEETVAAQFPGQIDQDLREERREMLMNAQMQISRQKLSEYVGQTMDVLIERPQREWPGLYIGRCWFQAPEVDGVTYVSGENIKPGDIIKCHVENSHTYDLEAIP